MDIKEALRRGLSFGSPADPTPPITHADFARSYVTYKDVFGVEPTWDMFTERLRNTGLKSLMVSLSHINSVMYVKGVVVAQRDLVDGTFDAELIRRLASVPELTARFVYSPAQTLLVMRAGLLHSPDQFDERPQPEYGRAMAEMLLIANDLLDSDLQRTLEQLGATDGDAVARALLPFSIRTTVVNGADPYNSLLARASIIFGRVSASGEVQQRAAADAMDLESLFMATSGLSLRDYFALGWMLFQWFKGGVSRPDQEHQRHILPARFFSQTRLDPATASRFLDELIQNYALAREKTASRRNADRLFTYDVVPFLDRPLYRVVEHAAIPTNLPFLAYRLSTGVYWKIFDSLGSADRRRLSAFYGHAVEAYAREVATRAFSRTSGSVFPEFLYRVSGQEHRTTDVVGLEGDQLLLFEVTATRFRMEATLVVDDPAAAEADLERIVVGKARQLHERINHFQGGHYSFGATVSKDVAAIRPIVVTAEPVPIWATTLHTVRQALARDGLLQQPGVQPLRVIGLDELEMLEAMAAAGHRVSELFDAHTNHAELAEVSLRNFLAIEYDVPENDALQAEYLAIGNHGASLLFNTHLGPATHEEIARRAYQLYEARGREHGRAHEDWLAAEAELRGD